MTTSAHSLIEVRHLSKRYGRVVALNDVSFDVRAGEVLGLIGPNGAGKTTLFECMAGVLLTTAAPCGSPAPVRSDAGAPPAHVLRPLTASRPWPAQPAAMGAGVQRGVPGAVRLTTAWKRWWPRWTCGRFWHPDRGALERPAQARVAGDRPDDAAPVLLVDEPFDGLDLRQTRTVAALPAAVRRSGRTLFLSIHQISDAARVCDRFVLIGGGRICGTGTLEELAATSGAPADLEEVFLALT
jgi:energy-coupling factor transporter ATP-binding protein EcfA2